MVLVDEVILSLERFRIIKQISSHKSLSTLKPMSRYDKGWTTLDLTGMSYYHIDQAARGTQSKLRYEYILSVEQELHFRNGILTGMNT